MSKEFKSEILKTICIVNDKDDEKDCLFFGQISWNGRETKGYDIRRFDKTEQKAYKGITVSYDAMETLIVEAIKAGCCSKEKIKNAINKVEDKIFSTDDFEDMFNTVATEVEKYKRDKYGVLRDDEGNIVIMSRRK